MRRGSVWWFACMALEFVCCFSAPVRADDWAQYRHDAGHTAVSSDRLTFPLKEVWSWNKVSDKGHTPLYHAAVWHNRVYFTGSEGKQRLLTCADAKTGKVYWSKPLISESLRFIISDIAGPAVTAGGKVFVYDWYSKPSEGNCMYLLPSMNASAPDGILPVNSFCVRTFDAMTGQEGPFFPLASMGVNGILPRLSLLEGVQGQEVRPVPPTFAGCPP